MASPTRPAATESLENLLSISCTPSQSVVGLYAGADAHGGLDVDDENLAVADGAGVGGVANGLDDPVGIVGRHHNRDADLGHQVRLIFGATVDFRVPFLTAVAPRFG